MLKNNYIVMILQNYSSGKFYNTLGYFEKRYINSWCFGQVYKHVLYVPTINYKMLHRNSIVLKFIRLKIALYIIQDILTYMPNIWGNGKQIA